MKAHWIPTEFICPLTKKVMRNPAVIGGGNTFEKKAIQEHFERVGATDPLTKKGLKSVAIVPNVALRSLIGKYWTLQSQ